MDKVSYQCKNVAATSHTAHNLSRTELLQWVNESLGVNVKKVEALCSGAEYCQFMNIIFPGCLSIKKVKLEATLEYEFISNLKLLQMAFRAVGCDKGVPIDKLIKGRFQENFEFLQWFKRFFDVNDVMSNEVPVPKQAAVLPRKNVIRGPTQPSDSISRSASKQQQLEKDLKSQIVDLKEKEDMLSKEKDFYFNKLRNIEILCNENSESLESLPSQEQREILVQKILEELYATSEELSEEDPKTDVTF